MDFRSGAFLKLGGTVLGGTHNGDYSIFSYSLNSLKGVIYGII